MTRFGAKFWLGFSEKHFHQIKFQSFYAVNSEQHLFDGEI